MCVLKERAMWYTGVIVLGAYGLYWCTGSLVTAAMITNWYVRFTCRVALVVLYYQWTGVPTVVTRAFRCARIWNWVRKVQFNEAPIVGFYHRSKLQYIYAVVPHGVYAEGAIMTMVLRDVFCKAVVICSSLLFWLPITREFAMLAGGVCADAQSIIATLNAGNDVILLPEGMRGAFHVDDPLEVLERGNVCKPRLGWIRCAMQSSNRNQLRIVPVYIQGAEHMYWRWNNNYTWKWLQEVLLRYVHYPWPMIHTGAYGTFWPRSVPLRVVCGVPIALPPKTDDNDNETLMSVHKCYCDAIRNLIKVP